MRLPFFKFQATGNDFIIIDDRKRTFDLKNNSLIQHLCNRKFGIGGDGLIVFRNEPGYDFRMVYFNADGYEGSMCGNGGRCITAFAHQLDPSMRSFHFLAYDGPHKSVITGLTDKAIIVKLQMQDVAFPYAHNEDYIVNTGSPHYIRFVQDAGSVNVMMEGRSVRNSPEFIREGINVNFAEFHSDSITLRTYERGVEEETLSCGTGVTAAAIAAHFSKMTDQTDLRFFSRGGELNVTFQVKENGYSEVYLTGEAMKVFEGEIEI